MPLSAAFLPVLPLIVGVETIVLSIFLRPWKRRLRERVLLVLVANLVTSLLGTLFELYKHHLQNAILLGLSFAVTVIVEWLIYAAYYRLRGAPVSIVSLALASLLANFATYLFPVALFVLRPERRSDADAIARMKEFMYAEAAFQSDGVIDEDKDGVGEYGFLSEVYGTDRSRLAGSYVPPPYPPGVVTGGDGIRSRGGYYFLCFLPTSHGYEREHAWPARFDPADRPGIDARERDFLVYAWPIEYDEVVHRAFVINAEGVLYVASNQKQKYAGLSHVPAPTAALDATGRLRSSYGRRAGGPTTDGEDWNVFP